MNPCRYWGELVKATGGEILTANIQKRYDLYNEVFFGGGQP